MDYLEEDAPAPAASTGPVRDGDSPDLELETVEQDPVGTAGVVVDPFLLDLLPEDRNARRRVVTALLRAVLAERKIT